MTTLDIQYFADALPSADADLAYLTSDVTWLSEMRARQTASFGLPYNYSGHEYPACSMPPRIAAMSDLAAVLAGHPFNNCLCNRYESGANTMGFHSDSYEGLAAGSRIAIASFGAPRTLVFRSMDKLQRAEVVLEHGSLLLMSRTTQEGWQHAVPRDPTAGLRISVTFRLLVAYLSEYRTRRNVRVREYRKECREGNDASATSSSASSQLGVQMVAMEVGDPVPVGSEPRRLSPTIRGARYPRTSRVT